MCQDQWASELLYKVKPHYLLLTYILHASWSWPSLGRRFALGTLTFRRPGWAFWRWGRARETGGPGGPRTAGQGNGPFPDPAAERPARRTPTAGKTGPPSSPAPSSSGRSPRGRESLRRRGGKTQIYHTPTAYSKLHKPGVHNSGPGGAGLRTGFCSNQLH